VGFCHFICNVCNLCNPQKSNIWLHSAKSL
jgi:hypothetical protein